MCKLFSLPPTITDCRVRLWELAVVTVRNRHSVLFPVPQEVIRRILFAFLRCKLPHQSNPFYSVHPHNTLKRKSVSVIHVLQYIFCAVEGPRRNIYHTQFIVFFTLQTHRYPTPPSAFASPISDDEHARIDAYLANARDFPPEAIESDADQSTWSLFGT